MHTDTAEHYSMLCALMEYRSGHDAERAYRALTELGADLSDTAEYVPSVRALLDEIVAAVRPAEEISEPEEDAGDLQHPAAICPETYGESWTWTGFGDGDAY